MDMVEINERPELCNKENIVVLEMWGPFVSDLCGGHKACSMRRASSAQPLEFR